MQRLARPVIPLKEAEHHPEGIHVDHVVVDGAVDGDKIRTRFPDDDSRRDRLLDIEGIVEYYAFLYRQHQDFEPRRRTHLRAAGVSHLDAI